MSHPLVKTAWFSLGSNCGDRLASLRAAAKALARRLGGGSESRLRVAGLFETSPVDAPECSTAFLNTAVSVETSATGPDILSVGLDIERRLGRVRRGRNGPRVIDIDLLLLDDVIAADAELTLPHPRMQGRRFVLEPLAEIAAAVPHPVLGVSIARLRDDARREHPGQVVRRLGGAEWLVSGSGAPDDETILHRLP